MGSKSERIIVLGGMRQKYLTRCQISHSKCHLYKVYQKVFFNIVKEFKSIESLSSSGKVQMGSKSEGNIVLGGLR